MWAVVYEVVPMTVVHIVPKTSRCLVEAFEQGRVNAWNVEWKNHEYLVLVGTEHKAFDVLIKVRNLLACCAIGVHLPHLHRAALAAQEVDLRAILAPHGVLFRLGSVGDLHGFGILLGYVEYKEFAVRLVLLHAGVTYAIEHLRAIG